MNHLRVAWCSRHPMTSEQHDDLLLTLENAGYINPDLSVEVQNVLWAASDDVSLDKTTNRKIWGTLLANYNIITGVFPPVSLESKGRQHVWTPISKQVPELRIGEGAIPFKHLRWAFIE
jgi:hypothetical protein